MTHSMVTNIRLAAAGSCSFPTVQKPCQELLWKRNRKQRPKILYFSRLSNVSDSYANCRQRKLGLTLELHFSVAGYGGLCLPFLSLRVRASDYRWCPIIDGLFQLATFNLVLQFRLSMTTLRTHSGKTSKEFKKFNFDIKKLIMTRVTFSLYRSCA